MTARPVYPVDEFANPNGIRDEFLTEREARLWLLSQSDRGNGRQTVQYDAVSERWVVVAGAEPRRTR